MGAGFKGKSEEESIEVIKEFIKSKIEQVGKEGNRTPFVTWTELAEQAKIWYPDRKKAEGNLESLMYDYIYNCKDDEPKDFTDEIEFIEAKIGKVFMYSLADPFKKAVSK